MATTKKLEADDIKAAPPGILYESRTPGFGLRTTAGGSRSFVFNYRTRRTRTERRLTIGSAGRWDNGVWIAGDWSVAKARARAKELRRIVDAGGDPMGELHEARGAPTVDELADRYLAEHASQKRPRGRLEDESLLRQWIRPELGRRKVADVAQDDLLKLHQQITRAGTPIRANRCLALASGLFSRAVEWKMRSDNPARGVRRNREHARARYLSPQELARLMAALAKHRNRDAADAITLLIHTGSRRSEVLSAKWEQIDLGRKEWLKPGSATKSGREHRIPLSAAALKLLAELRSRADAGDAQAARIERQAERESHTKRKQILLNAAARARARQRSPYLFPSDRLDDAPIMNVRKTWDDVLKAARLDARLHDLRHSFASYLVSGGLGLPLIASLLGHSQISTTQRYSHLLDDALRQGVERIGSVVTAAQRGETAEIVPLPTKRGRRRPSA